MWLILTFHSLGTQELSETLIGYHKLKCAFIKYHEIFCPNKKSKKMPISLFEQVDSLLCQTMCEENIELVEVVFWANRLCESNNV